MKNERQKDGHLVRNPVESLTPRVRKCARMDAWMKWLDSLSIFGGESVSFAYSFVLGVLILEQDQSCCPLSSGAFRRLCYNVLVSGDLLGFIDACSEVRSDLMQTGSLELTLSKVSKHRWVRGLSSAIQHALDVSLCVHPSVEFNRVATFLGWLKRLPVCIRPVEESIDAYYQADRRLSSINFDDSVHLPGLRAIWVEWLEDFELPNLDFAQHGSGSTADVGRERSRKWEALSIDRTSNVCLRSPLLMGLAQLPLGSPTRRAKVKFVPKQAGKDRTICMEPAWLQYLQQGVARSLTSYIDQHSQLSKYIDFRDQTRNQTLCASAYVDDLATIDLSDASDSVSWRLIRHLTRGLPICRYLYGTRSSSILLDGRVVQMDKYAPMGSALCFPIESVLFASIVEQAYRMHYGQASRGNRSGCSVYGDDIICPTEIYGLVVSLLHEYGFIVNTKKSFSSGGYYESCGVEYLYGARVTTLKHPRKHLLCQQELSPEQVNTVVDLANNLASLGLYDARRFLLVSYQKKTVRVGRAVKAFFDVVRIGEGGLHPLVDPYLDKVWIDRYQRSFHISLIIETQPARTRMDIMDAKFMRPRRTREQRLRDLDRRVREIEPDPRLSVKAVTYLSRFGQFDLLMDMSVESVGTPGTGRLRQRLRKHLEKL